jgi:simple sugar transport system substrate-binding protein
MKKTLNFAAAGLMIGAIIAGCAAPAAAPAAPAAEPAATEAATEAAAEAPAAAGDEQFEIVTVVKIAGINWFNRMEVGVKQFGEENGVKASLVGPAQADAAQQIPIIEDLIAQGVDALCVVPMDPVQLDPVLKKAMDAGIIVITHEAASQQNMDFDIEAFDNTAFGAGHMDTIAGITGGEGEYAVFVGSLGSETHNQWADGGINRQKEAYPNMVMVGDKNETFDDSQIAYEKTKELLKAFPNIKGFQGSASTDVAGIGQAVEEAGLQDQTAVVGTGLPSNAAGLLETGAIDGIAFWDPAMAGYACNKIALMLLNGETVGAGTNLGIPGYEDLLLVGDNVLYGNAPVRIGKDNIEELANYPF